MTSYTEEILQKQRIRWLAISFGLAALVLLYRLFYLQVVERDRYLAMAAKAQSRQYQVPASRGSIYALDHDKDVPLVLNQKLPTVYADPRLIADKVKTARVLAAIIGEPEAKVLEIISQTKSYVTIKTKLPQAVAKQVTDARLAGVGLVDQQYRVYPEGSLAGQLLGFVNADGEGQYGLEGYLNQSLAGQPGLVGAKTDTAGNPIATADNQIKPAVDGTSYVLTIDRNVQAQAEKHLKAGVEATKAKSGSIIIMDPYSGAITAMANYPTYDPANYQKTTDYGLFTNPVVADAFEPGSGFKVFSMAAGLDSGKVTANATYNDTGQVEIDGRIIRNAENHRFGQQNMTDIIQKSLNTGVIFVLRSLGGDSEKITLAGKRLLHEYLTKHFGFGVATGVEQSGEVAGRLNPPTKQAGNDVNYANMTFGQGVSATMVQMTAAVATIANGGKLYQPRLVHASIAPDGTRQVAPAKLVNAQAISPQTAAQLTTMMQAVVDRGSGHATRLKGYKVAGKTGTAQIPRKDSLGYEEGKNIGTFVGFAPAESPRFVMMVRVNEPRVNGFAESTTVPIFAEVTKWLLQYYAVPPAE